MDRCFFCGRPAECTDHVYFGTAKRAVSEKYGFTVRLCNYHHNMGGKNSVHGNREMDLRLKEEFQRRFEENHSREEFRALIGRSYL